MTCSSASSGGYANGAEFYVYKIDDERKPISGINFIILDANKNTIGSQVTGIDGKFRLYDYGPGTYYLREVATSATEDYRLLQFRYPSLKHYIIFLYVFHPE